MKLLLPLLPFGVGVNLDRVWLVIDFSNILSLLQLLAPLLLALLMLQLCFVAERSHWRLVWPYTIEQLLYQNPAMY